MSREVLARSKAHQRQQSFFAQRAQGANGVPAGAWLNALRQREQLRRNAASGTTQATTASGAAWTEIGPRGANTPFSYGVVSGRVTALAIDPTNSNTIYVGAADGGVWKTTDGGANWTPLTDDQASLSIGAVAIAPSSPNTIYVGTGEANNNFDNYYGVGILKSTDGGATWVNYPGPFVSAGTPGTGQVSTEHSAHIAALAVNPTNANTIFVGVKHNTNASSGVYRSTDGGVTWTLVLGGAPAFEVLYDPRNASIMYAALGLAGESAAGIYRSLDGGGTWSKLAGGLPTMNVGRIGLTISPMNSQMLVAGVASSVTGGLQGVYRSFDRGSTWTKLTGAPDYCTPQCWYGNALAMSPTSADLLLVGGGSQAVYRSLNATQTSPTFASLNTSGFGSVHSSQHAIRFTSDGTKVFVGNDGGVWSTLAPGGAVSWQSLNGTLGTIQFSPGMALHPDDPTKAVGGTLGNGVQMYSGTTRWENVACGDGAWTAFHNQDPTVIYASCKKFEIYRSDGSGAYGTWTQANAGVNLGDRVLYTAPLAADPANGANVYFGTHRVFRTTDKANTWTAISGDITAGAGTVSAIAVAANDSNVVFAATSDGNVARTTNGLADVPSWSVVHAGTTLPQRYATAVAIDPVNPNVAYVTYSGFEPATGTKGHVFATVDGGATWANISGDLPDTPVNDVVIDPDVVNTLYVATDVGVFVTANGGTNWAEIGTGLPNSAVVALRLHRASRTLRAATHGRGAWEMAVPLPVDATLKAVSVSPSSGSGLTQRFQFVYSDVNGAATITRAQMLFTDTAGVFKGSCATSYVPATNTLTIIGDGGTWPSSGMTLGAPGKLENNYCAIDMESSSTSATENGLTVSLLITFKSAFIGAKDVYMDAVDAGSHDTGWQKRGTWVPAALNVAPSADTVSPSAGTGTAQKFRFSFSDVNGYGYITTAEVLMATRVDFPASCAVMYAASTNMLYLISDAGAWQTPGLVVGTTGKLQNNQCSLDVGASAASGAGTTLTLDLAFTFKSGFTGTKNVFMLAVDRAGQLSGWQPRGTWTPNAYVNTAPAAVSVSPTGGTGTAQTFQLVYSDGNGYKDIVAAEMLVGAGLDFANSCATYYAPGTNTLLMVSDAGTWQTPGMQLGTTGTLQNSKCSINLATSSASGSGNNLALNLAVTFAPGFTGAKNIYMLANDAGGLSSTWQQQGTWTPSAAANLAPSAVAVTPPAVTSTSQLLTLTYADPNGYRDISAAEMVIATSVSFPGSCATFYSVSSNVLYIIGDSGSWLTPGLTVGAPGTLQNSQCSIDVGASSATGAGNTLTLNLATTLKSGYTGTKNIFMLAADNAWLNSGWQQRGTWTPGGAVNVAPTAVSVTPGAGGGTKQTFQFVFADGNGSGDITAAEAVIGNGITFAGSCAFNYAPGSNTLYLISDSGTWLPGVTLGVAGTVQNSQCSIDTSASSASGVGNNLTVSLAVTFKSGFSGSKNVYMLAVDSGGLLSGWQQRGTWSPDGSTNSAPQAVSVTPTAGSGSSRMFQFTWADADGYRDISIAQVLVGATLDFPNSCAAFYAPASNVLYIVSDAGSWQSPGMTLGAAGTLQNSQCSIDVGASSATGTGNNLMLNLAVTFKSGFTGKKNVYMLANDSAGQSSKWQQTGTWTPF